MPLRLLSSTTQETTKMLINSFDPSAYLDALTWLHSVIKVKNIAPDTVSFRRAFQPSPTLEVVVHWLEKTEEESE
jgi:hypothetical protein